MSRRSTRPRPDRRRCDGGTGSSGRPGRACVAGGAAARHDRRRRALLPGAPSPGRLEPRATASSGHARGVPELRHRTAASVPRGALSTEHRLSQAEVKDLITRYRSGLGTRRLARESGLSRSGIVRLLRRPRGRPPADLRPKLRRQRDRASVQLQACQRCPPSSG